MLNLFVVTFYNSIKREYDIYHKSIIHTKSDKAASLKNYMQNFNSFIKKMTPIK